MTGTPRRVLRYAAFTVDGRGGNPAGVVLDSVGMTDREMLAVAAEVGFSETAFLTPAAGPDAGHREQRIRYFSPRDEVAFCGHVTIATGIALSERYGVGEFVLHTNGGPVPVRTRHENDRLVATLTSVPPSVRDVDAEELSETLAALGWDTDDLTAELPPRVANAGNDHLVVGVGNRQRLAELRYDYGRLDALMARAGWTTVHLVWPAGDHEFYARDPFPPGGVVEDPATGAAAAAFGGYLRGLGLVDPPARVTVHQGDDMGRPSLLLVDIPSGDVGIDVTGAAAQI